MFWFSTPGWNCPDLLGPGSSSRHGHRPAPRSGDTESITNANMMPRPETELWSSRGSSGQGGLRFKIMLGSGGCSAGQGLLPFTYRGNKGIQFALQLSPDAAALGRVRIVCAQIPSAIRSTGTPCTSTFCAQNSGVIFSEVISWCT